ACGPDPAETTPRCLPRPELLRRPPSRGPSRIGCRSPLRRSDASAPVSPFHRATHESRTSTCGSRSARRPPEATAACGLGDRVPECPTLVPAVHSSRASGNVLQNGGREARRVETECRKQLLVSSRVNELRLALSTQSVDGDDSIRRS